jgi:cell wall-associated NlpC family hydrolase
MGKAAGAAAAVMLLVVALFLVGIPAIAAAADTSTADGLCGPGGTAQNVTDQHLDAEQMANAATIVAVVQQRGLPARAAVISLATAYQESKFHNIVVAVDHDSLGLFQQRVIYYTAAVAADPAKATSAFLDILIQQPNWQTRPLTDVAADVQQPLAAYRGLYAQWEPLATQLTAQLWTGPTPGTPVAPATASVLATAPATAVANPGAPCPGSGGDGGTSAGATPTPGPNGLTLTGSMAGNGAVTFALAQLGKPYLWGGTGPAAWDCSGLTMAAWASQGVAIPRVTYTQATTGTPVNLADARSGDLVLTPGSDGTATNPGHVRMVAGVDATGSVWLVEAPRTGLNVRVTPLTGWAGQITTIRRIG